MKFVYPVNFYFSFFACFDVIVSSIILIIGHWTLQVVPILCNFYVFPREPNNIILISKEENILPTYYTSVCYKRSIFFFKRYLVSR